MASLLFSQIIVNLSYLQIHEQQMSEITKRKTVEISEIDGELKEKYEARMADVLSELREQYEDQLTDSRSQIESIYETKVSAAY